MSDAHRYLDRGEPETGLPLRRASVLELAAALVDLETAHPGAVVTPHTLGRTGNLAVLDGSGAFIGWLELPRRPGAPEFHPWAEPHETAEDGPLVTR